MYFEIWNVETNPFGGRKSRQKMKKIKMSFEFSFLCEVLDDLLALKTFHDHHHEKLKQKAQSGNYDKVINNIIKESHRLRKYIVNVFWKKSKYENILITSTFYCVIVETIKLIKLNIENMERSYFNIPLKIVKVKDYDDTFFEQNILTKTVNVLNLLSKEYNEKTKGQKNDEFIKNSIRMTINLFEKVKESKHRDTVSLKTSKNFVKKSSTRLFHDEIHNLF